MVLKDPQLIIVWYLISLQKCYSLVKDKKLLFYQALLLIAPFKSKTQK